MHTQSLEQNLKSLLYSLPIDVHFAGFRGDTLSLAKAGWDFSMRQGESFSRRGYELQVVLRHGTRDSALYALSAPLQIDYQEISRLMFEPQRLGQIFRDRYFEIIHMSPEIRVQVIHAPSFMHFDEFQAVDPFPQMRGVTEVQTFDIRDLKFFKVAPEEAKELVVDPKQVPELLDMILKMQMPEQEAIREREKSRRNWDNYQAQMNPNSLKQEREVRAQIITLAV